MTELKKSGDMLILSTRTIGSVIDLNISGKYSMLIEFQRERGSPGSGSWIKLRSYYGENKTFSDKYVTLIYKERLRVICVYSKNTGTANVSLDIAQSIKTFKIQAGNSKNGRVLTSIDDFGSSSWLDPQYSDFLLLKDTPGNYSGKKGNSLVVNDDENRIEFTENRSKKTVFFSSNNVRFFGEFGKPNAQGWNMRITGSCTVNQITSEVFGIDKQVTQFNDNSDGIIQVFRDLNKQDWLNVGEFGASFGGVSQLSTGNGDQGFLSRFQCSANCNPTISEEKQHYEIKIKRSGLYLIIIDSGNSTDGKVILDGTKGNPKVSYNEWFKWEVVIQKGGGSGIVYINGQSIGLSLVFYSYKLTEQSRIVVETGSSPGINRVSSHDNFGVNIFTEKPEKIFTTTDMAEDEIIVLIPEGNRDYTLTIPDNTPRKMGSHLEFMCKNVGGKVTIRTENLSNPQSLIESLKSKTIRIDYVRSLLFLNTVNWGNFYKLEQSISLGLSDGDTLRWDGEDWESSDALQNNGTDITIKGELTINGGSPKVGMVLMSKGSTGLSMWSTIPYQNDYTLIKSKLHLLANQFVMEEYSISDIKHIDIQVHVDTFYFPPGFKGVSGYEWYWYRTKDRFYFHTTNNSDQIFGAEILINIIH